MMQAIDLAEQAIQEEYARYESATNEMPRTSGRRFPLKRQQIWYRRIRRLSTWLDESAVTVPEELIRPYDLSVLKRVQSRIPLKYQFRALNTLRELMRAQLLFPEYLGLVQQRDILDLSAGGCGIAEVFGHFGHHVKVCDYFKDDHANDSGDSYTAIHQSIGVTCDFFDGRDLPYAFDSNSFDLVLSYQAIDAYGPVSFWYDAVEDMRRIARDSVGLVLNPAYPKTKEHQAELLAFIETMTTEHNATLRHCAETGLPALRIPAR